MTKKKLLLPLSGLLLCAAACFGQQQTTNITATLPIVASAPQGYINLSCPTCSGGGPMWVSSHFATNSSTNLWISLSQDGQNWSDITGSFVYSAPSSNVVHDPTLAYVNGTWYAAYLNLTLGAATTWGLASSPDLVHWTFVQNVSAAVAGQTNQYTWSPTWFFDSDGSVHILLSIAPAYTSAVYDFNLYETHPTSSTNLAGTWSTPVLITGTALPVGTSIAQGPYNPFILKVGSTYNLWYGNSVTNYIEVASSTSLTSGYNTAVH